VSQKIKHTPDSKIIGRFAGKKLLATDPHRMTQTKWVGRFAGKERSKYKSKVTKVEKLRIGGI